MKSAPNRGVAARMAKEKASRLAPKGFQDTTNFPSPRDSAAHAQNQVRHEQRKQPSGVVLPAHLRRQQITALLLYRHGGPCRTDDAEAWFDEVAIHLVLTCRPETLEFVANEWATRYTPNLSSAVGREVLDRARRQDVFYTSAHIGRRLNVTTEEKHRLGLSHIAAVDISPEEVANQKRARNRARMQMIRRTTGQTKTPRDQCIGRTIERRPGEPLSSFYRRVKRERESPSA